MPGPSPSAHQVLVYSGPGVSPLSLSHTILTLSLLLLPHYIVQPVTPDILSSQPWEPSCALLVVPGGRDLPFVEELTTKRRVTKRIKAYVEEGGKYLGICAGAYFGTREVRFDVGGGMEVVGERDLAFFSGSSEGPTFPGFQYASESGSRAVSLFLEPSSSSSSHRSIDHIYYNGGGHFILPSPRPSNVEVLARYADTGKEEDPIAVVLTRNGKGKSVLCSIHPEYPLNDPPARLAINKLEHPPGVEEIEASEKGRIKWVEELLRLLGLDPPNKNELLDKGQGEMDEDPNLLLHPTHPSPIFVLSHPNLPDLANNSVGKKELKVKMIQEDGWDVLRDGNDQIHFGTPDSTSSTSTSEDDVTKWLARKRRDQPKSEPPSIESLNIDPKGDVSPPIPQPPDFHAISKTVLLPSPSIPYTPRWTPLFNFDTYWTELDNARKGSGRRSGVMRKSEQGEKCALGDLILYGETVTSTQTMLDRNPLLLTNLTAPLAFLATFQLSGRGRGSNVWLSPAGCLQFSLLLDLPSSLSSKMVFIQYIMALAVCEAVDEDGKLGVRIKWPNDIYAEVEGIGGTEVGSGKKGKAKLGGILVNTNFVGGKWRIVVGCGINVLNALPTTSLSQLHGLLAAKLSNTNKTLPPAPTMEGTFAKIMNSFENKWEQFIEEKGFKGFMNEYHGRWLHSGQEVTLTTTEPHTPLRILSITPDHGLLRCIPLKKAATASSSGLTPLYNRTVDHSSEDRYTTSSSGGSGGGGKTEFVDLQPDGNSFDLMSGLIKRKV
ncbi:biotin-[acetyl-CoA-carboxylase] ligase [Kwoniella bestiolae CBS 10118]|uniref:Biotin-[acetyl-CoA-carboxylase] ligase n=1 Tax=Kwoniella bestiolae CBS 10118 TaxID=1296100 RepID=A0A1B9GE62_9TREE|nr:biotin-[acetyl-CoA-carboxylase] ligase [Kwoniella bestiolae CBS 10118]OCF29307.1 biotin-[acetyl-CoA-carboxylase] ligase [Kwoniella bestiolae CBS 10118]